MQVVGALGFEPGASCAQVRRTISWKSFLFNLGFENKRVRKIYDSGTMYGNVAAHAWSPPNFPHNEITAKVPNMFPHSCQKPKLRFGTEALMFLQQSCKPLSECHKTPNRMERAWHAIAIKRSTCLVSTATSGSKTPRRSCDLCISGRWSRSRRSAAS